jgi:hypothetical protein
VRENGFSAVEVLIEAGGDPEKATFFRSVKADYPYFAPAK